jgi:hypothetical protein
VTPVPAIVAAASAALERIDLFVQAVEFLLGQLALLFGLLEQPNDAFEVAQNSFEAVTDSIDVATQRPVNGALPFVGPATSAVAISVSTIAVAPIIATVTSAIPIPVSVARTILARTVRFALALFGMFAIGFRAFFLKFVGFVRFIGRRVASAFAFGRFIDGWRNILVLVTWPVFALGIAFAPGKLFFAVARLSSVTGLFRWIIFPRRAIVTTSASTATATAPARGPSSPAAATTSATITITRVSAPFFARALATGARAAGRTGSRRILAGLRFRKAVFVFGSGMRRRRGFPSF